MTDERMTAVEEAERIQKAWRDAVENYRRDARFAAIAQSCVAAAMHAYGEFDPRDAYRAASHIATDACALLLQRIYEDDAELKEQKAMADKFREMALEGAALRPMPMVIQTNPESVRRALAEALKVIKADVQIRTLDHLTDAEHSYQNGRYDAAITVERALAKLDGLTEQKQP